MILEGPLLNLIRLDTFDGENWQPWAAPLNTLRIQRGGTRSGTTSTVEPGILSATLVNAGDPLAGGTLKPNLPVRVVTPYTTVGDLNAELAGMTIEDFNDLWAGKTFGAFNALFVPMVTIFTGRIHDLATAYMLDKGTGKMTTHVTITATDAVASHANVTRYGAVVEGGAGFETWAQRIIRLSESAVAEVEPPADDAPIVRYAI